MKNGSYLWGAFLGVGKCPVSEFFLTIEKVSGDVNMPFLDVNKNQTFANPCYIPNINLEILPTYPACMVSNPRGAPKSIVCFH